MSEEGCEILESFPNAAINSLSTIGIRGISQESGNRVKDRESGMVRS